MKEIADLKKEIVEIIKHQIAELFGIDDFDVKLSFPPTIEMGDFCFECFSLSKELKKNPAEIAKILSENFKKTDVVENISATGPYLNVKIRNIELFSVAINNVLNKQLDFGNSLVNKSEKIMVEYLSPNTNKPLHLGHVRNGALGMSMSLILESSGAKVIKANLINDRGVHICKSMLSWKKWGDGATPESMKMKGDHFVGYWYVRYAKEAEKNPELENEIHEMLVKWEKGDPETVSLWKKMNAWVYEGYEETFKSLGLEFDKFYYESNTYKLGKELVETGVTKGIFRKDEKGAIVVDLPADEFGVEKDGTSKKATLIRKDGTSIYITQDLETARLKFEENNLTKSIYVVGSEQDYHFKVLFKLLNMLGFSWANNCFHLSYGMVYLPEGKMKSREGKVVDADDLVDGMIDLAKEEIKKRDKDNKLISEEIEKRAKVVADAAIKYYLLQYSPRQDIYFDPKSSISFEGNTGPYCQYTYARAKSILEKASIEKTADFSKLGNTEELILINKIMNFPLQLELAALDLNPTKVVQAIYEIAKAFNQFYQKHQVLNLDDEELVKARLYLVEATSIAIKKGLSLLNIGVLEKM